MTSLRSLVVPGVLVALAVIVLGQLSKLWIFNHFAPGESVAVTPFFNLVLVLTRAPRSAFWQTTPDGSAGFLV